MKTSRKTKYFLPVDTHGFDYEFEWTNEKAPVVASDWFSSISEIDTYLNQMEDPSSDFKVIFDKAKKSRQLKISSTSYLQIWVYLTMFLVPFLWMIFSFQILQESFSSFDTSLPYKITLFMLMIVSLTFASPPLYLVYRSKQDAQDAEEQLELLAYLKSSSTQPNGLGEFLFEKDNQVFWRIYRPHWRLSLFYPEFTFLDILGLFSSVFSLVYLFTWFLKSFSINASHLNNLSGENVAIIILNIVLLSIFLGWVFNGYRYGTNSDWYLVWKDERIKKNISTNLYLLFIGLLVIIFLEIKWGRFTGTYAFLILLSEIPLVMAFITNKFRLFMEFNKTKDEIVYLNNLQSIDLDHKFMQTLDSYSEETQLLYSMLMIMKVRQQLSLSPTIPATRIRSYGLLITFTLSIVGSFISAFNSSVDQFTRILSLIFP